MEMVTYKDIQRMGQKEYIAAVIKGEYPYLSVLEDLLPDDRINRGVDLGLTHIPMEFVVGTRASGRTKAFARNFMPLMGQSTEFGRKWDELYKSQMEVGIREPIKVYEYMNRYYVEEGHKRVSVLKFCGADTVYAHVIRILPISEDTKEVALYRELIDFERYSGVNYVEFTMPGSYERLQQMVGKKPGEAWTEEEKRDFSSAHYHFRKAFEGKGGKKPAAAVGDAMMAFLEVYGYPELLCSTEDELAKKIEKIREDITLRQTDAMVNMKFSAEEVKTGLLTKVFGGEKVRKVAFIHDARPGISGWTLGHEHGREHVQRVFAGEIETTAYLVGENDDPTQVIMQAVKDGNTVFFTTSSQLQSAALRCAVEHPDLSFLNCSQFSLHRYIRTYHTRMYEAYFMLGAIAGALSGDDEKIGFAGYNAEGSGDDFATSVEKAAQIANVNAFALGAQMVNPGAKIVLEWFGRGDAAGAFDRLAAKGIDFICSLDVTRPGFFGLVCYNDGAPLLVARPIWNWGVYYERLIRRILDNSFQAEYEESAGAVSYYWGSAEGVLDVECTDCVPSSTKNLLELLQSSVRTWLWHPFKGTFRTQSGEEMNVDLRPEQMHGMTWLAENIEGSIPKPEPAVPDNAE